MTNADQVMEHSRHAQPPAGDSDLIRKMTTNQRPKRRGAGPNPWLVVGVALAAGILVAKWIDWRGHAHPRD